MYNYAIGKTVFFSTFLEFSAYILEMTRIYRIKLHTYFVNFQNFHMHIMQYIAHKRSSRAKKESPGTVSSIGSLI
jgi:hypothetical protein